MEAEGLELQSCVSPKTVLHHEHTHVGCTSSSSLEDLLFTLGGDEFLNNLDLVGSPKYSSPKFKLDDGHGNMMDSLEDFDDMAMEMSSRSFTAASQTMPVVPAMPAQPDVVPNVTKQTSVYRGVHFHKKSGKWRAQIQLHGKRVSIGSYATDVLAAKAYDQKAREAHGDRAKLNFPTSSREGKSAAAVQSTSNFRGVCITKRDQRWLSQIQIAGNKHYLGTFDTEIEAALAYDAAARTHHGARARLNFPDQQQHLAERRAEMVNTMTEKLGYGREQAHSVAENLHKRSMGQIYSSSSANAFQEWADPRHAKRSSF